MKKPILIGWKISKIGVYQDNFGGDIEFQHITCKDCGELIVADQEPEKCTKCGQLQFSSRRRHTRYMV